IAQLEAFTRILKIDLLQAKSPDELKARFGEIRDADVILIDTASCNPYLESEIGTLCEFMKAVPSEPVLVNPAGIDAYESADIANAFADGGATRVMISRLDVAARLGGALYGADSGNLSLCNVSMTAQVADGLTALSPLALAKLLIPSHRADTAKPSFSEVVK
ncbi:MAG TPA: GTP-binding protein, partial [Thalassospira sp.]|nr:GTP-binding protein [Thalassospira sp.]